MSNTISVLGCLLGFALVMFLCYRGWSVYLTAFIGACVVTVLNSLPLADNLLNVFMEGTFSSVKNFFLLFMLGCIQAKLYTKSGAALIIAETVMNRLIKGTGSNTAKNMSAMGVIILISAILCLGGVAAAVVIVLLYPVALAIFKRCDIPKKFILGVLGAGSYTFSLTMPGSPEIQNIVPMTILGTTSTAALIPGLVGAAVEIAVILLVLNSLINKSRANGEHFVPHPLDPQYDESTAHPSFIAALIPIVTLFVLFNFLKLNINLCLVICIALSTVLFLKYLGRENLKDFFNEGAVESVPMTMSIAIVCAFANTVTNTAGFQSILTSVTGAAISPLLICSACVALMCMLTGGSSAGQMAVLPLVAPKLLDLGLKATTIHRVATFASTTLDSLPCSGAILMLLPMCRMKLKEVYPYLFVTTVLATSCGTAAVIAMCALFPSLA